eukprot:gnl/Chilomastix_cuspidata/7058.p1 GENE.gnl/Chilomastix_cuspidata/7058~~gnl/Chilomastix_cuspidata/7058.p1  ORF type:complete len:2194 (+),score=356.58 gnl/Chilomastix_cuspidata/7058:446-7027(+)
MLNGAVLSKIVWGINIFSVLKIIGRELMNRALRHALGSQGTTDLVFIPTVYTQWKQKSLSFKLEIIEKTSRKRASVTCAFHFLPFLGAMLRFLVPFVHSNLEVISLTLSAHSKILADLAQGMQRAGVSSHSPKRSLRGILLKFFPFTISVASFYMPLHFRRFFVEAVVSELYVCASEAVPVRVNKVVLRVQRDDDPHFTLVVSRAGIGTEHCESHPGRVASVQSARLLIGERHVLRAKKAALGVCDGKFSVDIAGDTWVKLDTGDLYAARGFAQCVLEDAGAFFESYRSAHASEPHHLHLNLSIFSRINVRIFSFVLTSNWLPEGTPRPEACMSVGRNTAPLQPYISHEKVPFLFGMPWESVLAAAHAYAPKLSNDFLGVFESLRAKTRGAVEKEHITANAGPLVPPPSHSCVKPALAFLLTAETTERECRARVALDWQWSERELQHSISRLRKCLKAQRYPRKLPALFVDARVQLEHGEEIYAERVRLTVSPELVLVSCFFVRAILGPASPQPDDRPPKYSVPLEEMIHAEPPLDFSDKLVSETIRIPRIFARDCLAHVTFSNHAAQIFSASDVRIQPRETLLLEAPNGVRCELLGLGCGLPLAQSFMAEKRDSQAILTLPALKVFNSVEELLRVFKAPDARAIDSIRNLHFCGGPLEPERADLYPVANEHPYPLLRNTVPMLIEGGTAVLEAPWFFHTGNYLFECINTGYAVGTVANTFFEYRLEGVRRHRSINLVVASRGDILYKRDENRFLERISRIVVMKNVFREKVADPLRFFMSQLLVDRGKDQEYIEVLLKSVAQDIIESRFQHPLLLFRGIRDSERLKSLYQSIAFTHPLPAELEKLLRVVLFALWKEFVACVSRPDTAEKLKGESFSQLRVHGPILFRFGIDGSSLSTLLRDFTFERKNLPRFHVLSKPIHRDYFSRFVDNFDEDVYPILPPKRFSAVLTAAGAQLSTSSSGFPVCVSLGPTRVLFRLFRIKPATHLYSVCSGFAARRNTLRPLLTEFSNSCRVMTLHRPNFATWNHMTLDVDAESLEHNFHSLIINEPVVVGAAALGNIRGSQSLVFANTLPQCMGPFVNACRDMVSEFVPSWEVDQRMYRFPFFTRAGKTLGICARVQVKNIDIVFGEAANLVPALRLSAARLWAEHANGRTAMALEQAHLALEQIFAPDLVAGDVTPTRVNMKISRCNVSVTAAAPEKTLRRVWNLYHPLFFVPDEDTNYFTKTRDLISFLWDINCSVALPEGLDLELSLGPEAPSAYLSLSRFLESLEAIRRGFIGASQMNFLRLPSTPIVAPLDCILWGRTERGEYAPEDAPPFSFPFTTVNVAATMGPSEARFKIAPQQDETVSAILRMTGIEFLQKDGDRSISFDLSARMLRSELALEGVKLGRSCSVVHNDSVMTREAAESVSSTSAAGHSGCVEVCDIQVEKVWARVRVGDIETIGFAIQTAATYIPTRKAKRSSNIFLPQFLLALFYGNISVHSSDLQLFSNEAIPVRLTAQAAQTLTSSRKIPWKKRFSTFFYLARERPRRVAAVSCVLYIDALSSELTKVYADVREFVASLSPDELIALTELLKGAREMLAQSVKRTEQSVVTVQIKNAAVEQCDLPRIPFIEKNSNIRAFMDMWFERVRKFSVGSPISAAPPAQLPAPLRSRSTMWQRLEELKVGYIEHGDYKIIPEFPGLAHGPIDLQRVIQCLTFAENLLHTQYTRNPPSNAPQESLVAILKVNRATLSVPLLDPENQLELFCYSLRCTATGLRAQIRLLEAVSMSMAESTVISYDYESEVVLGDFSVQAKLAPEIFGDFVTEPMEAENFYLERREKAGLPNILESPTSSMFRQKRHMSPREEQQLESTECRRRLLKRIAPLRTARIITRSAATGRKQTTVPVFQFIVAGDTMHTFSCRGRLASTHTHIEYSRTVLQPFTFNLDEGVALTIASIIQRISQDKPSGAETHNDETNFVVDFLEIEPTNFDFTYDQSRAFLAVSRIPKEIRQKPDFSRLLAEDAPSGPRQQELLNLKRERLQRALKNRTRRLLQNRIPMPCSFPSKVRFGLISISGTRIFIRRIRLQSAPQYQIASSFSKILKTVESNIIKDLATQLPFLFAMIPVMAIKQTVVNKHKSYVRSTRRLPPRFIDTPMPSSRVEAVSKNPIIDEKPRDRKAKGIKALPFSERFELFRQKPFSREAKTLDDLFY